MIEAIFELFIEILFEALLPLLLEVILELGAGLIELFEEEDIANYFWKTIGLLFIGSLLGVASAFLLPQRFLPIHGPSGISLILSPLIVGFAMQAFGKNRFNSGKARSFLATFGGGATFAFAMAFWRWILITHYSIR